VNLGDKVPIDDGTGDPEGPCVFCGKRIEHVNAGGVGCVAGGVVGGKVFHFMYCNDPLCPEHKAALDAGDGVRTCSCEDYRAYDVLGDECHICGQAPCQPEDPRSYRGKATARTVDDARPSCQWCGQKVDEEDAIALGGRGACDDGYYCSGDCLFHSLLGDRTDEATFSRVQEIINIDPQRPVKAASRVAEPKENAMSLGNQAENCAMSARKIEIWAMVDSDGDYVASHDYSRLSDLYEEDVQTCSEADGLRKIKITLNMPLPTVVKLVGEVPAQGVPDDLTVATMRNES